MGEIRSAQTCFADYVKQAGTLSEVAVFCRVRTETVLSWQEGTWPRGEQLYLLWAFLEMRGYRLAELDQLPGPSYQLLLIIASGQLSFEDVQRELKYQNLQDVYRLFRNASGLKKERAWKLEELVKQHLQGLEDYRRASVGLTGKGATAGKPGELATSQVNPSPTSSTSGEQSSLARLLRLVVKRSGEVSPDELKRQLNDLSSDEVEEFALLLLELV